MKKIIDAIILFLLLLIICLAYFQYGYTKDLKEQIALRDTIIYRYESIDSIYGKTLKRYVDTVEKYITPQFIYGDKKISSEELIETFNKHIKELYCTKYELAIARDSLQAYKDYHDNTEKVYKSLYEYKDSTIIYRGYTNIAEKKYGIEFTYKKDSDYYIFYAKSKQIDSALIILPYFRDRLKYNPKDNSWEIITRKGLFN